jgi:hypothetical protein
VGHVEGEVGLLEGLATRRGFLLALLTQRSVEPAAELVLLTHRTANNAIKRYYNNCFALYVGKRKKFTNEQRSLRISEEKTKCGLHMYVNICKVREYLTKMYMVVFKKFPRHS